MILISYIWYLPEKGPFVKNGNPLLSAFTSIISFWISEKVCIYKEKNRLDYVGIDIDNTLPYSRFSIAWKVI